MHSPARSGPPANPHAEKRMLGHTLKPEPEGPSKSQRTPSISASPASALPGLTLNPRNTAFRELPGDLAAQGRAEPGFVGPEAYVIWKPALRKRMQNYWLKIRQ